MKKLLLLLLLVVLPLQATWTLAAGYCSHEGNLGSGHFGHHQHQAHADTSDDLPTGNSSAVDHASCHASPAGMLFSAILAPALTVTSDAHQTLHHLSPKFVYLDEPERPKWNSV